MHWLRTAVLAYCIDHVEEQEDGSFIFKLGQDEIHVDEKWFYITTDNMRVYLTEEEALQYLRRYLAWEQATIDRLIDLFLHHQA